MLRTMLTALLLVVFIGPTNSQGVQSGTAASVPFKNQLQERYWPGGVVTTKPGAPGIETNTKKKSKKDKCVKLPQPIS